MVAISLLLSMHTLAAASSAPADPLEPSSKWRMDYGANECRLIRIFGAVDRPVTFQLAQIDPSGKTSFDLSLVSSDLISAATLRKIRIFTEGREGQNDYHGYVVRTGGNVPPILYVDNAKGFEEILNADVTAGRPSIITVAVARSTIRLALGKMKAPLAALRSCMDDLVKTWGYDPVVQSTLSSPPTPVTPITAWLNWSDYPASAMGTLQTGGVKARLDISDAGTITGCHVMAAGGSPIFETLTCNLFKKNGKFHPAIQKNGTPVASFFSVRVFWKIEQYNPIN